MDIAELSMAMSASRLGTQWGIAVLDKALDMFEVAGEELTAMMESSVTPHLGQNIDIRL